MDVFPSYHYCDSRSRLKGEGPRGDSGGDGGGDGGGVDGVGWW